MVKRSTVIEISIARDQMKTSLIFVIVVQSLNHVQPFMTAWTAAYQVSLSFTISRSLL